MKYCVLFILVFWAKLSEAQTFQIGGLEDQTLRLMQLEGKLSPEYSFISRPYSSGDSLTFNNIHKIFDNNSQNYSLINSNNKKSKRTTFSWLPISLKTQYNSHHPFGWNDGAMIPAKGLQTLLSAGFFAKAGPFSVQLQPEIVYASNPNFENSSFYGAPTSGAYKKIFKGQSALRLNLGKVSFGLSSENVWWGPGSNSSLIMSNNSAGFLHLTFNSIRPIKTPIGSFEWQLIGGKLEHDSTLLSQVTNLKLANVVYPESQDWRYFNGLSLTWQPKWVKGLFVGVNRSFQAYSIHMNNTPSNFIDEYLPVFGTLFKKSILSTDDQKYRDQVISLFTRYLLPKDHAEIYLEFGWNDHSYNIRDFLMAPTHSAAYIIGFKKAIPKSSTDGILIETEITQMQESPDGLVRGAGNWYEHGIIRNGYTNLNQIMGSGSGFGNNVQNLSISKYGKGKKVGLQIEKIQNYPNLLTSLKWNDYVLGFNYLVRRKLVEIKIDTKLVYSENFAWVDKNSKFNLFANVGLRYSLQ
jgi:hypothetical protein